MTTKTTTTNTPKPAAMLRAYLRAEVADDVDEGSLELPRSYVSKNGLVYVHSRSLLAWARDQYGADVSQRDVQAALRKLGLTVRATALPTLGKSVGFYVGKPKGVSLRGVPVRDRRKAKAAA